MKKLIVLSVLCLLTFAAGAAFAEEAERIKQFSRSKVSLQFDAKKLESLPAPKILGLWLCSGSTVLTVPSLGECPSKPGYTTAGIATCYQEMRIPKKRTFTKTEGGLLKITCELDWESAEPLGGVECDYSQCFYVSEPEFPWPGTVIWPY